MPRALLLFVDGVGLGEADTARNPFMVARLPTLERLLDGQRPLRSVAPLHATTASLVAIDATLGMDGLPQSGTGQAALFTGLNAVALHGRHFGPWVPVGLQPLVREQSVLARAQAAGHRVAFANAYPEEVLRDLPDSASAAASQPRRRSRRRSFLRAGPPLAAAGAGLLTRHTDALRRGDAVASEITHDGWRQALGRLDLPTITAAEAGRNLVRIADDHHLTLFAHYATDYAGHRRDLHSAVTALERLDEFLGGILEGLAADMLLFLVSDHGNIEDAATGHTRNPAIGLVAGNGHAHVAGRLTSLVDVAPTIMQALSG